MQYFTQLVGPDIFHGFDFGDVWNFDVHVVAILRFETQTKSYFVGATTGERTKLTWEVLVHRNVQLFALHRLEHSLLVEFQKHREWVIAQFNLGPETHFRCAPLENRGV